MFFSLLDSSDVDVDVSAAAGVSVTGPTTTVFTLHPPASVDSSTTAVWTTPALGIGAGAMLTTGVGGVEQVELGAVVVGGD